MPARRKAADALVWLMSPLVLPTHLFPTPLPLALSYPALASPPLLLWPPLLFLEKDLRLQAHKGKLSLLWLQSPARPHPHSEILATLLSPIPLPGLPAAPPGLPVACFPSSGLDSRGASSREPAWAPGRSRDQAARARFRSSLSNLTCPICQPGQITVAASQVTSIPERQVSAPQRSAGSSRPKNGPPLPLFVLSAHCSLPMHGSFWVLVRVCINPGDNGAALREGPRPPHWVCVGVSVQGDTAEMPRAGPAERAGYPRAGGGQLVPALYKGQQFSTAGEEWVGVSGRAPPPEHTTQGRGWSDQRLGDPAPAAQHREGPLFLWKRGATPFSRQPSWSSPAGRRPC